MQVDLTLVAAVTAFVVGFLAFWSNPRRTVNRLFLTLSLHAVFWLMVLRTSFSSDEGSAQGLFLLRLATAIGALFPLHFWMVQQGIAARLQDSFSHWLRKNWGWCVISLMLGALPFTDVFIPPHSTAAHRLRGWGYYVYILVDVSLYGFLIRDALSSIKTLVGVRRLELQVWLGGGCVIGITVVGLMALTDVTRDPSYIRLQPLLVLIFYGATAFVITSHRIFDVRQILLVSLEKSLLVAIAAGMAYLLEWNFGRILPVPFDALATMALTLWSAAALNSWLDRLLHFYPVATVARQAAFAAARREARGDKLEKAFLAVLKGWGQSDRALILTGTKDSLRGDGVELAGDSVVANALRQLRWVTPERLARERFTPERQRVGEFLAEHGLGILVIGEGQTLTALVGVGVAASRRPFTYPQVTQLIELASIIESALERAYFSMKVQHTEQLATVGLLGASLAHEIRNPLVTIKTFAQLLPQHYQDPAFREKFFRLIGTEVGRIDRLTEQLLDLAAPRAYAAESLELHPMLRASLDLVSAKATDRNIQFLTDFQAAPDRVYTDASAAKQVMLNLCFNAIQAVESRTGGGWVKIATRNVANGIEMAVADSGPGIAAEIQALLFQPFQTTKSSGFGLGLAICSDILTNLNATISVDPPAPGQGATFRVIFPCQP